jgi:glucose-1-phosphatase
MPRPKAVVFDLGKVLVDFDYQIALRRLAPLTDRTLEQLNALLNQSPLLFRYESGRMTSAEFYDAFRAASAFRGDFAGFSRIFADIFTPIGTMIDLHGELKARGLRTFVFSNTNEVQAGHIRQRFPFFRSIDGAILSFEHGAMKPEPRLYAVVERMTGCQGSDLFYLDDRPENVAVGRERGWQGIVHADPCATRRAMEAAGLLDPKKPLA